MIGSVRKTALVVLDGWGIGAGDRSDAVAQAHTPVMDDLLRTRPHATLRTDGEHVGLPDGQMGNSEVGHLNIGAGRVVYQDLVRIDRAIADGSLEAHPVLREAFALAAAGRPLHFIGLLSQGGVHSHQRHLAALCGMAARAGVPRILVHAFTDGRDADPRSGLGYLQGFRDAVKDLPVTVASVVGRYFAMDRDKRWERVRKAYDLLVHGHGVPVGDAAQAYSDSYAQGVTDEFIEPHVVTDADGKPLAIIAHGDVVICWNFRTDRCREITEALTQRAFPEQAMTPLDLHYITLTEYDASYSGVRVMMERDDLHMTLGETVASHGLRQLRAAETEKYPHVTFFFSGGREEPFPGETRILVPSPKVATYDLKPEMSAPELAERVADALRTERPELVVLNIANPDMVGHTGVFEAIVRAVEVTDTCLGQVLAAGRDTGYSFVIIADHGNADRALNPDGSPNTAHSTNPVPVVVVDDRPWRMRDGILADVAPTILKLMGLPLPAEMTGLPLLVD